MILMAGPRGRKALILLQGVSADLGRSSATVKEVRLLDHSVDGALVAASPG
jgi:hypothetical protein